MTNLLPTGFVSLVVFQGQDVVAVITDPDDIQEMIKVVLDGRQPEGVTVKYTPVMEFYEND